MRHILDKLKSAWHWFQRAISSAFVILLCSSFILWYILKLQYTYTTDYSVLVDIEGELLRVPCVIEGKGTNLVGYRVQMHKEVKIPLSDLKYTYTSDPSQTDSVNMYIIEPQSLQSAISVRFSDIKVISIGDVPPLRLERLSADEQKK